MGLGHISVPIRRLERLASQKPRALPGDRNFLLCHVTVP